MKVFAISDLHLSENQPKPMDIFGDNWDGYFDVIKQDWQEKVSDDDIVLIPGDISWAMNLTDALADLNLIGALKGKKVILRGNHDYWWSSISKVRTSLPSNMFAIQNDALKFHNVVICGSRGWTVPNSKEFTDEDEKIYNREAMRLKMSFEAAGKIRDNADKLICIMHYPPFNVNRQDNEFTKIIVTYSPDAVVYGHLHGKDVRADLKINLFGTKLYLTSTDLIKHRLVEIEI